MSVVEIVKPTLTFSPNHKLAFAYIEGPDDRWYWAIVSNYQSSTVYDTLIMGFAEDAEPFPAIVEKLLAALESDYL